MTHITKTSSEKSSVKENILAIVWWGLALGLVAGCTLNSISGFDWVYFYYPRAHDFAPKEVVNPVWIYFVLAPIALLPLKAAYLVFSLLNVAMLWFISRASGANRFGLLLSFPALWVLWYGQLDIFVALGVALGLWAVQRRQGVWLGLALLLLLVKPHIGAPLAVLYFWWGRDWRALALAGLVFLLSLLVWGVNWPLTWLHDLIRVANPPADVGITTAGQQTNISLYPYGLLAWLILLLPMSRLERAASVVAATFLSVPYAPTYSLVALLALPLPWWVYLASSAPVVTGPAGYWVTTFAPLGYLAWLAARHLPILIKKRMMVR